MIRVITGIDKLVAGDFSAVEGKRVAVLCHQASIDSNLEHTVDSLLASRKCAVVKLFGPEHGLAGAMQDMEAVNGEDNARDSIPVISLYGSTEASLRPTPEMLRDVDAVVVDLQDIGSRYYTYAQTLLFMMETCREVGVEVIVLDRPNPLGGVQIEGASLTKGCHSFCGIAPIANRHGLTIGELAELMNAGFGDGEDALEPVGCKLSVVKLGGWKRESYFDETGLPWVLPSPNMPTLDTAIVYPGTCLFEATNLSEGRGTTRPFELLGAPFIDAKSWAKETFAQGLTIPGVSLRPTSFKPQFQKWSGEVCNGVQVHVTDRNKFQPFRLGLALISAANKLYPNRFSWRKGSYEFIDNVPAIDLLYGSAEFRETLEAGNSLDKLEPKLKQFEIQYKETIKSRKLYP